MGDGNPGLGTEICFIEKFVRGLRIVATFARAAGSVEAFLGGEEEGGDLEVENLEEGTGEEEGFGFTGEAASSALGVMGIVSSGAPPKVISISIGVKIRPGISGDASGTRLAAGGASDR